MIKKIWPERFRGPKKYLVQTGVNKKIFLERSEVCRDLYLSEFSKEREKAASRGEFQKNKARNQMDTDMKVQ